MATPALESFCCIVHNHNGTSTRDEVFTEQTMKAYNIICIVCGSLGILGSVYQLYPRRPSSLPQTRRAFLMYKRQNIIICLLALADLLATIGIVVRSSFWLSHWIPWRYLAPIIPIGNISYAIDLRYLTCAITSGWIQYFYICTYFWTTCYAIDVYRMLKDKPSVLILYHAVSWGCSFFLTVSGLISLYYPSLLQCTYSLGSLLPHYLSTYLTILGVMLANPVLYWKSANTVKANIMLRHGRYTDHERTAVNVVSKKFYTVLLVFIVCWFPNILNAILLIVREKIVRDKNAADESRDAFSDAFIILWMAMAVLNPLQGFLNALVYSGAGGFNLHLKDYEVNTMPRQQNYNNSDTDSDEESQPLLSYRGAPRR